MANLNTNLCQKELSCLKKSGKNLREKNSRKKELICLDAKMNFDDNAIFRRPEILKLRDKSFTDYHSYGPFLKRIEKKFGALAARNIREMTKIELKRKIIEDDEAIKLQN